jgi:hypothetical protein
MHPICSLQRHYRLTNGVAITQALRCQSEKGWGRRMRKVRVQVESSGVFRVIKTLRILKLSRLLKIIKIFRFCSRSRVALGGDGCVNAGRRGHGQGLWGSIEFTD